MRRCILTMLVGAGCAPHEPVPVTTPSEPVRASPRPSSDAVVARLDQRARAKPTVASDASVAHIEAPPTSFNARVLALIRSYPERGFGGYAWPSRPGADGTSRDLRVGNTVIARAGTGNHCVGITFEVFWRALDECAGGSSAVFDVRSARKFRLRWYVPEAKGTGPAEVLPPAKLGVPIALEDARPGDFVQAWNRDGTFGHSMVFLGWERAADGKLVKIRYWSSQPWTEGIGESEMELGDGGFDPTQIHIVRASCRDS